MTPWYSFLALSVLAVACTYAFAYWRGHGDGRVDGRLEVEAEQDEADKLLEAPV